MSICKKGAPACCRRWNFSLERSVFSLRFETRSMALVVALAQQADLAAVCTSGWKPRSRQEAWPLFTKIDHAAAAKANFGRDLRPRQGAEPR